MHCRRVLIHKRPILENNSMRHGRVTTTSSISQTQLEATSTLLLPQTLLLNWITWLNRNRSGMRTERLRLLSFSAPILGSLLLTSQHKLRKPTSTLHPTTTSQSPPSISSTRNSAMVKQPRHQQSRHHPLALVRGKARLLKQSRDTIGEIRDHRLQASRTMTDTRPLEVKARRR